MKIKINDQEHEVSNGINLATLIEQLGLPAQGIAVAIDYEVVPRESWPATPVTANLELMIIHAVSGG